MTSALLDLIIIKEKVEQDLILKHVIPATQITRFISFLLGLVPKLNGDLHKIHHLSYLRRLFVNDFIIKEVVNLKYAILANILAWI